MHYSSSISYHFAIFLENRYVKTDTKTFTSAGRRRRWAVDGSTVKRRIRTQRVQDHGRALEVEIMWSVVLFDELFRDCEMETFNCTPTFSKSKHRQNLSTYSTNYMYHNVTRNFRPIGVMLLLFLIFLYDMYRKLWKVLRILKMYVLLSWRNAVKSDMLGRKAFFITWRL